MSKTCNCICEFVASIKAIYSMQIVWLIKHKLTYNIIYGLTLLQFGCYLSRRCPYLKCKIKMI